MRALDVAAYIARADIALSDTVDVVKSRVQNTPKVSNCALMAPRGRLRGSLTMVVQIPGQVPKYNWTFPSLALIAREEGVAALYSGFVPKVLRLAPGGGVLLLVVEFTLDFFRKQLGSPYI